MLSTSKRSRLVLALILSFLCTGKTSASGDSLTIPISLDTSGALTDSVFQRTVLNDVFCRYPIGEPERGCTTIVWLNSSGDSLSPLWKGYGSIELPGSSDSLFFWFYAKCDASIEREQLCWAVPAGKSDLQMAVMRGSRHAPILIDDIDLDTIVFPAGSLLSGCNLPQIQSLAFMPAHDRSTGYLAIVIEDNAVGNHPHSDARQGIWRWDGDSLQWVGSLSRGLYTVHGATTSWSNKCDVTIRKGSDHNVILDYVRSSRAEANLWFGKLTDHWPIVLELADDQTRVRGLRITPDSILFIRRTLPMLVGERHFVDINDPSCPADIAAISLFAQTGHGEPLLGAVQLGGSTGYHVREQLKGSISPTVLAWIERDSLAFKFVMPDNRKVAFWFDPDLRVEPTDSIISGDEMVYVVHPHERTSPFRVEGFRVSRGPTGMDFTLVDSGEGRFYWYNEGLEVTIRISRDQIGFQTVDSLALCGFGMESLWWEGDEPEGLMENSERLPKGFDRNKPSTWGNLVLGKREDHVNERELWRYLEQDGE